jgi:hypothetical protein
MSIGEFPLPLCESPGGGGMKLWGKSVGEESIAQRSLRLVGTSIGHIRLRTIIHWVPFLHCVSLNPPIKFVKIAELF